jgi:hypothetical protein
MVCFRSLLTTVSCRRPGIGRAKALAKIEQSFTDGIANIFTDPRIV